MAEAAIRVENAGKKYCKALKRSMLYGAADIACDFFGVSTSPEQLRGQEFWAVKKLTFELPRGQSLGIVGRNGSGKTSLLKLLSGIFLPDCGRISIHGRVGALIEVGAGFHPLLTGRENVFINGMILGMTEAEIRKRFDQIIDFADIGDFIDAPVRNYSSGMYVRLGFAIAIHAPVDILLVDEILAVGDLAFGQKCMKRILEFRAAGGTVVLVTHVMKNVKFICDQAMWIDDGQLREFGDALQVVNAYEQYMVQSMGDRGEVISHDDQIEILDVRFPTELASGDCLTVEAAMNFGRRVSQPIFNFHLFSAVDETLVVSHHSDLEGFTWDEIEGRKTLRIATGPLHLRRGDYLITLSVSENHMNNPLLGHHKKYKLSISNTREIYGLVDGTVRFCINEDQ